MTTQEVTPDVSTEPLILLSDGSGGFYAVPRSIAERYRASEALLNEVRARLAEQEAAGEVSGYAWNYAQHPLGPAAKLFATTPAPAPAFLDIATQYLCPSGYRPVHTVSGLVCVHG